MLDTSHQNGKHIESAMDKLDGLVKSPISFVIDLKRRLAIPHVLPNRRFRYYASYIELFPESIYTAKMTFYEIIKLEERYKIAQ